jgi:segregation and condensation protein B
MTGRGAEIEPILESLLCAHGDPLTVDRAVEVLGDVTRGDVSRALASLQQRYESEKRGFRIAHVAGGYQLRTAPEHAEYVRKLLRQRPMRLSRPMLETLAIVAYRQAVTRAEIEAIRGVDVDSTLNTLLERRLIRIAGRKEAPGRPLLYATSREFLEVFGLSDLSELPTLRELGDVSIEAAPEIDLRGERPADDAAPADGADAVHLDVSRTDDYDSAEADAAPGSDGRDEENASTTSDAAAAKE